MDPPKDRHFVSGLGLRPAPKALLRGWHAAPRPPWAAPRCPFRGAAPARAVHMSKAIVGSAFGLAKFEKLWRCGSAFTGVWGPVGPQAVERWASRRWQVGGQGAAAGCARRPRAIGLSTAERTSWQCLPRSSTAVAKTRIKSRSLET